MKIRVFCIVVAGALYFATKAAADRTVFEYRAESGLSPQAAGFAAVGSVSGTFANNVFGIPELGAHVWESSHPGPCAGYVHDVSALISAGQSFRLSGYFRGVDNQPSVPPAGAGLVARQAGAFSCSQNVGDAQVLGQWYFQEIEWTAGSPTFRQRRWQVAPGTGTKSLVTDHTGPVSTQPASLTTLGSNVIVVQTCNEGSSFIREQFDNIKLERLGCEADINGTNGVTVQDIFDFLAAWFAGNTAIGNFNADCCVSTQDIFDFLAAWFAGCS